MTRFGQLPATRRDNGGIAVAHYVSGNIDEHVALIKGQVDKSMADPESRQLAVKIVSATTDRSRDPKSGQEVATIPAWGLTLRAPREEPCPSRAAECELVAIWDFVVLNIRYVYDPPDVDVFATLEQSLRAGGGDCDDLTIAFAALLKSIGFHVVARVISVDPNPDEWVHVYPLVGCPKDNPSKWIALDASVRGATPGWQYPQIRDHRDYWL